MKEQLKSVTVLKIFNEEDSEENQVKALKTIVQEKAFEEKENLISYLKSGRMILFRPQLVPDLLSKKETWMGSASIYTDGKWVWANYIIHYVEKYNIQLPSEFILEAQENNWISPEISVDREEQIIDEMMSALLIEESQ